MNIKNINPFWLIIAAIILFLPIQGRAAYPATETTPTQQIALTEENQNKINIYFFWAEGCTHCAAEKIFLQKITSQNSNIIVNSFEVTQNAQNAALLQSIGKKFNLDVSGVPFTMIGNKYFPGWLDEESTGEPMKVAIECVEQGECQDILSLFFNSLEKNQTEQNNTNDNIEKNNIIPESLNLPLIGNIQTKNLSLPLLTIVIGALDGFNPCAMWTLIFLISLLLGMQNRKRMWILGGSFIAASAIVYFLFLTAWLNVFLFLGLVVWIRILIGIVALASGIYNLKEYHYNKKGVCKISTDPKQKKIFDRLKTLVQERNFWIALGGIILLGFAVNLVELVCSAGLPAVYTQVLSLSNLPAWQYYLYLLLYIFVFMLDDMIVFFVAMATLKMTGISGKYSRWSHLIGGIIMLILGILLIVKPGWLMFG